MGTQRSGWIPIEERLPQEGEDVLFYNGSYIVLGHRVNTLKGVIFKEDSGIYIPEPTHWQYLPESPNEEHQ